MNYVIDKNVVNEIFYPFFKTKKRFVILYGGAGSSKSYTTAQKVIFNWMLGSKKERILVCRKVGATRKGSVFKLLCDITESYGIKDIKPHKSELSFRCSNGNEIITSGLDDVDKLKSIAGITKIWIEEADQITEDDFNQINTRLRGVSDTYFQIILSFNPIDENHWIKKRFFDYETEEKKQWIEDNVFVLKSTYLNNKFIDEQYKQQLESYRLLNPYHYSVYCLGNWGKYENGNAWLYQFKAHKHVVNNLQFYRDLNIYLCVDFNVDPLCAIVCQKGIKHDDFIHVIREYRIENASLEDLASIVNRDYPIKTKMYLIADASGYARDVGMTKNEWNKIVKLQRLLGLSDYQLRFIPKKNPTYENSRELCNSVLFLNEKFRISSECKYLILDLQNAKVDEKKGGDTLYKDNTAEYNMNLFDCFRYFINSTMSDFIDKYYGRVKK